ncbi:MAG TPA: glycerol kinase GlpK [Chloroflexota bacterium]|nr:glycerol kinase GlpK [Chloroflexota bacterium]
MSIDQGTTGTTVLLVDQAGEVVGRGYREVRCDYPRPGWVEQDAEELWRRSLEAIAGARQSVRDRPIVAIGITNQRETTVLWDARTGEPVAPAIVWQCRRTAGMCEELRQRGLANEVGARTGLVIDPYFSGTKLRWLLESQPELRRRALRGELRFGTIDSWLIWKLSGGQVHRTDYSNASRTLLYDIYDKSWDPFLLDLFGVPPEILPEVAASATIHCETVSLPLPDRTELPGGIPVAAIAGDQQAALFGQACYEPGMVKATYGTGAFLLMNCGVEPVRSRTGLLTTLACGTRGEPIYAIEGSIFVAGAAIQWLRDQLGIVDNAAESEALARQVPDSAGVYFVPAFVGLGAPYWDADARGALVGLTRGVGRSHIARAALEAIAYQTRDVVEAMTREVGRPAAELRIDGGAAANNFLAEFLANLLGAPVVRPRVTETTALGAAFLAGLATGFWASAVELARLWQVDRRFEPTTDGEDRDAQYAGWQKAVERVRR